MERMQPIEGRLREALAASYRLEHEVGSGGMATVYAAEDFRHGRRVAVKVLFPSIASALGTERFLREIRFAARLQHPNIVSLIDSGDVDGLPYYVMPYVDGSTLRAKLARDGELPVGEALRMLREIADALAYAHAQGVAHRDLKPENVLLAAGHAQLVDFGIAKAFAEAGADSTATRIGIVVGTPGYMAPEQMSGGSRTDHRTDIYSFGVLACEMLTGANPFAGLPPDSAAAQAGRDVPPVSAARPVPRELDDLIARCLQNRPADRWQSASEIVSRIDGLLASRVETTGSAPRVAEARFRLTESVCRRLQRSSFRPDMIGDEMHYLDNGVSSRILVCFLPPIGLDAFEYEPHLESLPYRAVALTPYGFEPSRRRRFSLPLVDHLALERELLADIVRRTAPSTVVVAGFSSAADVALQLGALDGPPRIDGLLLLGGNLALETCFLTRVLGQLESGDERTVLRRLASIGEAQGSLDEWLTIHRYLVRMLTKFRVQIEPLRDFAREIVRPYESEGTEAFCRLYREASRAGRSIRCVFEDDATYNRLVRDVQIQNMDFGVLGPNYADGTLLIERETNHFDLVKPELVTRHLGSLLESIHTANPTAETRSRQQ